MTDETTYDAEDVALVEMLLAVATHTPDSGSQAPTEDDVEDERRALLGHIARLRAALSGANRRHGAYVASFEAEIAALRADRARLAEALEKYGQHRSRRCDWYWDDVAHARVFDCDCGLRDAIDAAMRAAQPAEASDGA